VSRNCLPVAVAGSDCKSTFHKPNQHLLKPQWTQGAPLHECWRPELTLDSGKEFVCIWQATGSTSGSLWQRFGSHPAASGRRCVTVVCGAGLPFPKPGKAPCNQCTPTGSTTTASGTLPQREGWHPGQSCPRIRRPSDCWSPVSTLGAGMQHDMLD
jgi:hypothetical protein